MTDVTISVEDGLRLSELQGDMARLQYDLYHVDVTTLPVKIGICVVMTLLFIVVLSMAMYYLTETVFPIRRLGVVGNRLAMLCIVLAFAVVFITMGWALIGFEEEFARIGIESDIADVRAQMDAIEARYGMR